MIPRLLASSSLHVNSPLKVLCERDPRGQLRPTLLKTKGLFTWSGEPRSSGVGFFCFHALGDTKQKKPTLLDRGPPHHVNRPLGIQNLLKLIINYCNCLLKKTFSPCNNTLIFWINTHTSFKSPSWKRHCMNLLVRKDWELKIKNDILCLRSKNQVKSNYVKYRFCIN